LRICKSNVLASSCSVKPFSLANFFFGVGVEYATQTTFFFDENGVAQYMLRNLLLLGPSKNPKYLCSPLGRQDFKSIRLRALSSCANMTVNRALECGVIEEKENMEEKAEGIEEQKSEDSNIGPSSAESTHPKDSVLRLEEAREQFREDVDLLTASLAEVDSFLSLD
jgi:hypothetical protein